MQARQKQSGFSLVEMGIIVAVLGLILGAVIVPLSTTLTEDFYEREEARMAQIPRAIVGYALRHRTVERVVEVIAANTLNVRRFTLPAGRPYLPCPDVDGDGHEDRSGYDVLGIVPPNVALLTITNPGNTAMLNDLLGMGSCAQTRGGLPWQTLGLPPDDTWGNRYTYHADGVFSNAMVGFNQNSIADSFDIRIPITLGAPNFYPRRTGVSLGMPLSISIVRNGLPISYNYLNDAAVVCQGGAATCPIAAVPTAGLAVGRVATAAFTAPLRSYIVGDVVDGLPFIVVSHGKNGSGAVNHEANVVNSVTLDVRCSAPLFFATAGANNVNVTVGSVFNNFIQEASNVSFMPSAGGAARHCPVLTIDGLRTDQNPTHFITRPRAQDGGFDDIVIWRTREELSNLLINSAIFPAPDIPLLREY